MAKQSPKLVTPEFRLRKAGVVFDRLEDVPAAVVRETMRRGFPNTRMIELPAQSIRESLEQPLLADLLVTRIGFSGPSPGHYIPRPKGSLDHIVIHCVDGQGWLEIAGIRSKIDADTVVCIPAGEPHAYGAEVRNPWSIYWLHLTGTRAAKLFQFLAINRNNAQIYLPHSTEVLSAFEAVWAALNLVHTWESLVLGSLRAYNYLALLQHLQRGKDVRARASEDAIHQSISFMTNNLSAETSLVEFAALAGMSVSNYTIAFRKLTGFSPIEYFNRLRIQQACQLLEFGSQGVAEIGRELGFQDPYYFSHAFKKIMGVSPAKYRK